MTSNAGAYNRDVFINTSRNKYNNGVVSSSQKANTRTYNTKVTGINDRPGASQRGATKAMPQSARTYASVAHKRAAASKPVVQEKSLFYCFMHGFVFPALKNAKVTIKELFADSMFRTFADKKPKCEAGVKRASFSLMFIFYLFVFSSLLIFLSLGYGKINEYTAEIEHLKSNITEQNNLSRMLEIQIDSRDDLREVEHEAVARLGMIKEENVPKKYISLERRDMIEINPDVQQKANMSVVMSGAAELLSDLFR